MQLRRRLSHAISAVIIGAATMIAPANAHPHGPVTCHGTASFSTELIVRNDRFFKWDLSIACDTDGDPDTYEAILGFVNAPGFGRCGRWTAAGGDGWVINGHVLSNMRWDTVGDELVVTGSHDGGNAETRGVVAGAGVIGPCGAADADINVTLVLS